MKLLLGPLAALITAALCFYTDNSFDICVTAAIAVLCMFWWAMEVIPVPATSLIPLGAFPLLGILDGSQVAASYGSPLILLLLGGFLLSKAMESSNAHKKLAMLSLRFLGYKDSRQMVFSFMGVTALLSMWISNTATVLMMLPIVLVVLEKVKSSELRTPLLLGLAYSASIGGMGTPVGTTPNLVMMSVYEEYQGTPISFLTWMSWSIPVVVMLVPIAAIWLTRSLKNQPDNEVDLDEFIVPWTPAIRRVLTIFALTALAWVTRTAPFGGWGQFIPTANDASVAFVAVVLLFVIGDSKGGRLLTWEWASKIPWGVLLLFAGGITLAKAFQSSGLSTMLGEVLAAGDGLPIIVMLLIISVGVCFMTETTSNTASTVLLMPILAVAAQYNNLPIELVMLPAALSASCAFMLPVATAPNAVVYGAEVDGVRQITIKDMMRHGAVLNLIAGFVIAGWSYLVLV